MPPQRPRTQSHSTSDATRLRAKPRQSGSMVRSYHGSGNGSIVASMGFASHPARIASARPFQLRNQPAELVVRSDHQLGTRKRNDLVSIVARCPNYPQCAAYQSSRLRIRVRHSRLLGSRFGTLRNHASELVKRLAPFRPGRLSGIIRRLQFERQKRITTRDALPGPVFLFEPSKPPGRKASAWIRTQPKNAPIVCVVSRETAKIPGAVHQRPRTFSANRSSSEIRETFRNQTCFSQLL